MKIAGYISISILLVLACAGRGDRVKVESEMQDEILPEKSYQPEYKYLIDIYNSGKKDEFYLSLDKIRIRNQSNVIKRIGDYKSGKLYPNPFSTDTPEPWGIQCAVKDDSSSVSILILDEKKKLLWIEYNDIMESGDYIYYIELPILKGGEYYYLLKVESEESLKDFYIIE